MNKLKAAYKAYLAWLNSLPTPVQKLILSLEAAIAGVLITWASGPLCLSKACLWKLVSSIGGVALVAFHNWVKDAPSAALATLQQQASK